MTPSELEQKIKKNMLGSVYFFYGEETYLAEDKIKSIRKRLIPVGTEDLNVLRLEGKKADLDALEEFLDSFPQLSEKKLAVVKNTGYFSNMNSKEFRRIKTIVENASADNCLIFEEDAFDKKKEKNLAFIEEKGGIVRFDFLAGNQAQVWLERLAERCEKQISDKDTAYLVRLCGPSLGSIYREFTKVLRLVGERRSITRQDIDAVVVKSADVKIYELFDDIVESRRSKVMEGLKDLLSKPEKEGGKAPLDVLNSLIGNVSELLMVKLLKEEGVAPEQIAEYFSFKRPVFVVNKLYAKSKKFGDAYLRRMIYQGLHYDVAVKSGKMDPAAAAELYVVELLG